MSKIFAPKHIYMAAMSPDKIMCCMCSNIRDKLEATPLSGDLYMCADCIEKFKDAATIVCARCHAFIGKVVPGTIDCGYTIKPKEVLHLNKCVNCCKDIKVSEIIEITEWMKYNRDKKIIVTISQSKDNNNEIIGISEKECGKEDSNKGTGKENSRGQNGTSHKK